MNNSIHRRTVLVGLFVFFAIVILGGGILTVGNLNDAFTHRITVSVVFPQVNGLKKGDNIWFSGLKVGIVRGLDFDETANVAVELRIDQGASQHIRHDVTATIGSDGLIGNRIVVLKGGTPGARDLADGDVLQIGDAISTEALMATLAENNSNLLAITTDIKDITGKITRGEGTLGKLVNDETLYASVTETAATLSVASTNARGMTASLSSFASDLNRPGHLPKDLVNDKTTYPTITATVAQLKDAGDSASAMMDGLAKGAADTNTPLGALSHDTQTGADLKATLSNLREGSALLSEDLEAAQHNILLRRYFRRKARAEAEADGSDDVQP